MNPPTKTTPRHVRCLDNTLQRDVLTVGQVYEVYGEEHGNYRVCGRWMTKGRFEAVEAPAALVEVSPKRS